VSEVITAVIMIAVIFVLGLAFGYLVALFTGRER
jgi:flagellin-like protein